MNKKSLYFECYSGISGDMSVAALLDLGVDQQFLQQALASLALPGYEIKISRVKKNGIDACDFQVILTDEPHEHEHHHPHEHEHHHPHTHRNITDIHAILDQSSLSDHAKEIAKDIFLILAQAESKAHGLPIEEVHFHEVGAIDSIIDTAAVAICLDQLDIDKVYFSQLYEGQGWVNCQHGLMPVPVPAVVNIAAAYRLPLHLTSQQGEMVTPTGAAIAAALSCGESLPESFVIEKIGLGAGKKDFPTANILRIFLLLDGAFPAS